MKTILTLAILTFMARASLAQQHATYHRGERAIHLKTIGRDSIAISLNDQYYLIEDSCAQIIRYAHINLKNRIFNGRVKDVSKVDSTLVVSEGNYNTYGLKDGEFILHYLNGNLRAKGRFKNNKYEGHWELYYDSGKPQLTFDAVDNDIKIIDAWGAGGTKIVDNGKGEYKDQIGEYYWVGKIVNGKPDGTWKYIDERKIAVTLASEYFKKGQFHDGTSPIGDYKDSSRLVLIDPDLLPLIHAEKFIISPISCDGTGRRKIIHAQYRDGASAFNDEIKTAIAPALRSIRGQLPDGSLGIEGLVNTKGLLEDLKPTSFNYDPLGGEIARRLFMLPALEPATADGVPVKEKFSILFTFENGLYSFHYYFRKLEPQ